MHIRHTITRIENTVADEATRLVAICIAAAYGQFVAEAQDAAERLRDLLQAGEMPGLNDDPDSDGQKAIRLALGIEED